MTSSAERVHSGNAAEPVLLPELPIVDSHIHLWTRDNYFAQDFLADVAAGHNVQASIYAECGMCFSDDPREAFRPVGETHYVLDQVKLAEGSNHALAAGILGCADLMLGDGVKPVLEAHAEAAKGRFRGVRYRVAWDADPVAGYGEVGYPSENLLQKEEFQKGARCLAEMGLVLDLWGFHTQLDDIARFAARLPELKIVVDHVGGPLGVGPYAGRRDEVFKIWSAGIRAIAEMPNVHIKLSGLAISRLGFGFQDNGQAASSDELVRLWSPYVRTCAEVFGPERSIFGSNYPVDRAAAPYSMLLNAYKKMLGDLSTDELTAIFAGNARRVYNLEQDAEGH
ncbi:Predicted metal-dependent hydrolase, TIM-barrel fold [Azospirillum oryzae]|uniref:Predicted metal-dependent hydrolase, TIM-barrel fold n=1 Tax=Azospirillum oryzae TaxID=286727 RepID=A0A1X7HNP1_9PROT|nr:amidohydrolase family protein [Azospirillum oryzae]SMF90065.1 Predicted metal-dependent hydrolase, TIM-barrel fold [Azospirillum oryzae]